MITNKSKFKFITIEDSLKYVEDVSGNKIKLNTNASLEISAGRSIKKLTLVNISSWSALRYVVRNCDSIKNIAFEDDGKEKNLGDGKFSIKKSVFEEEELNTSYYLMELNFDKTGRTADETVEKLSGLTEYDDGATHIYSYRYDDGGNLYKLINSNPDFGYNLTEETYYYDKNNNMIEYSEE